MKRVLLVVGIAFMAIPVASSAQTPAALRLASLAQGTADKWMPPRTQDGHPSLEGTWTTQTFTPLERPARYAGQEFLTEEEATELTKLLTQAGADPLAGGIFAASDEERRKRIQQTDPTHYDNAMWLTTSRPKALSSRRTSLIFDPPDGRIPALTAEARQRAAARRARDGFDSYENRPLQARCVVWTHEGPPMMPPPYNDILRIFQMPGYVIVYRELATAPRIIPTNGRPHISENIRRWNGDSRGRWEGDTLVVETKNFNEQAAFQGATAALRVVERFTRVGADRIAYQFTVEDPNTWTRPWSAEIPMLQTDGLLYEYACHEGNYGIVNTLRGARVADQEAAEKTTRTPPR